jgi:hypothetical protein
MPDETENKPASSVAKETQEEELPMPWKQVQAAIWLIGLAILFWQGWIFPGILVLVAISGVTQALMQAYVKREAEKRQMTQRRTDWLPSKCPQCGGPLSVETVRWTGAATADCPYCSAHLKPAA